MDSKSKTAWLRERAGIVEQVEARGATELMLELRHLADKWDKARSYQGVRSEDYDSGHDAACGACAEELLSVIEKHRKN